MEKFFLACLTLWEWTAFWMGWNNDQTTSLTLEAFLDESLTPQSLPPYEWMELKAHFKSTDLDKLLKWLLVFEKHTLVIKEGYFWKSFHFFFSFYKSSFNVSLFLATIHQKIGGSLVNLNPYSLVLHAVEIDSKTFLLWPNDPLKQVRHKCSSWMEQD